MDDFELPDSLPFYLPPTHDITPPVLTTLATGDNFDEIKLHRQLVCWCNVQRCWYYVINEPKVEDLLYDNVENYVKQLEEESSYLKNPYSPTKKPGSNMLRSYPKLIVMSFFKIALDKGKI